MRFPPLLAVAVDLVPLAVVQQTVSLLFHRLLGEHPDLFERLGEYRDKRFAFVPSDLPLAFVVEPARPTIQAMRKRADLAADARVDAPLFLLMALLEGRCDADALFFSRDLAVTGDMEAMLAMRSALDDSDIDLPRDLSRLGGPLAPLLTKAAREIRRRALIEETA